jgi:hypothetical protein
LAARSASWLTDADGALEPAGSPLREFEPQPLRDRAATQAVVRTSFRWMFTVPPLDPDQKLTRGRLR